MEVRNVQDKLPDYHTSIYIYLLIKCSRTKYYYSSYKNSYLKRNEHKLFDLLATVKASEVLEVDEDGLEDDLEDFSGVDLLDVFDRSLCKKVQIIYKYIVYSLK